MDACRPVMGRLPPRLALTAQLPEKSRVNALVVWPFWGVPVPLYVTGCVPAIAAQPVQLGF